MSDIMSRLILRTEGWDKNIEKAEKSVQSFEKGVASTLGKVAGAIGLAMGAQEAFNKVIHSSQILGDEFDNTIAAAKSSVNAFFQSLATGDWSAFNGGLAATIANFKQLAILQDGFNDAKLSLEFETSQFERDFSRLEGIVDDQTRSAAERKIAFSQLQSIIKSYQSSVEGVSSGTERKIIESLNARFGRNFTIEDINKFISKYNYSTDFSKSKESKALANYINQLNELKKKEYTVDVQNYGGRRSGPTIVTKHNEEVSRQIEALKASNAELEKMRILTDDNDEARKKMIDDYVYLLSIQQKAAEFHKRSLEKQNTIMGLGAASGSAASPTVSSSPAPQIKAVKQSLSELASLPKPPILEAIQSVGDNKEVTSIQDITSAVTSLSGVFSGEASNMVQYFANIVMGAAQAAAAIAALIPVKKMEANANAEVAVTGAAASAAATPFVGWMMAAGAVASVIAAMASIPKFAKGGIVPGTSWSGDKVPAMLNSGEMVLNRSQQSRLFAIANGGTANAELKGSIRISGRDLYVTLRNHMKATGDKL